MNIRIKAHYHWIIAIVVFLEMVIYGGIMNNLGIFLVPVTEDLQISRGSYSVAMSLRSVVNILSILISGFFFRHLGYRKSVPLFMAIATIGMIISSVSNDVVTLCIGAVLLGTANGFCFTNGAAHIIGNWFRTHYGLVLGGATSASGLGGGLFGGLLAWIINAYGWRAAYIFSGILMLAMAFVMFLLVRSYPHDVGLAPYGEGSTVKIKKRQSQEHWEGFGLDKLKKMPSFYLMIFVTFFGCLCYYTASTVFVPYLQDCGISFTQATFAYSVMLLALSGTKFLLGWLSDLMGAKKVALLCSGATVVTLLLLSSVTNYTVAICCALVLSFSAPLSGLVANLLAPNLFGHRVVGDGMSIILATIPTSAIVANSLLNYLHDYIGSYRPIYQIATVVAVAAVLLYLLLFAAAKRDRKRAEKQCQQIQS